MDTESAMNSFASSSTLKADEDPIGWGSEVPLASEFAKAILAKAALLKSAGEHEDQTHRNSRSTVMGSQTTIPIDSVTPEKSTTLTTISAHSYLPTPGVTPTRNTKRSHACVFHDTTSETTPTKVQAVPTTPTPTPTRRKLFHNTPRWSTAYKSLHASATDTPQFTPSSPSPTPAPPSPDLKDLQAELAKPLPSDLVPATSTPTAYNFRPSPQHRSLSSAVVIDQDESGTYNPEIDDIGDAISLEEGEVEEEEEEDDSDIQITRVKYKPRGLMSIERGLLSIPEMQRLKESVLEQVCGKRLEADVASNRRRGVYLGVIRSLFEREIDWMRGM